MGQEKLGYLKQVWNTHNKQSFRDVQRWYNRKPVVPTLEKMKGTTQFYHGKRNNMLKLGCTPPNLEVIYLPAKLHKCQLLPIPGKF